jgi:glutamate carboxypeptidase
MAALEDEDLLEPFSHVTLFCGGDEETDMESSLSVLREVAPETDAAFVLEAGRENGDIVGARKTSATYVLQVQGHEAHAGVEPHKGANAILALAQKIVALHGLNGMRPGVTVNVGVAAGGTLPNVVPGHAAAQIDVRAERAEDMQPVGDAITAVAAASLVPGTRTTLDGGWKAPPMPETPQTAALARLAAASAAELGFTVRAASTGGISYANHLAGLGIPVLDGFGPIGGLDHSPQEYISVASIVPRTALLALLMLRTAEHGRQFA